MNREHESENEKMRNMKNENEQNEALRKKVNE